MKLDAQQLIDESLAEIQLTIALSLLDDLDTEGISFEEGNAITMNIRHNVAIPVAVQS